jgi:CCR4-NOT transcription complex subunit 3
MCRYSRLEVDTLFFIFYFQPSTRQQQLAAKALRASGWLFHMQVMPPLAAQAHVFA